MLSSEQRHAGHAKETNANVNAESISYYRKNPEQTAKPFFPWIDEVCELWSEIRTGAHHEEQNHKKRLNVEQSRHFRKKKLSSIFGENI